MTKKCYGIYCDEQHFLGKSRNDAPNISHLCPYAQELGWEPEKSQKCDCCNICTQQCQDDI